MQKPVINQAGALVTQIPAVNTANPVNCTLLRWVEGQPYHRDLEQNKMPSKSGKS